MLFTPQNDARRNPAPAVVSLAVHLIALFALMGAPALRLPRPSPSEYRQKIAGREEKIVFYKFRKELPRVSNPKSPKSREPLRAEVKARQQIVASAKNAPKSARMIWTPAPDMAPAPMELPNVLAVKLPDPPVRVEAPDAPELKPDAVAPATVKTAALPPKAFVPPAAAPKPVAARPGLAQDAPELEARDLRAATIPIDKLPPKAYVAPAAPARTGAAKVALAQDAPQLAVVAGVARAGGAELNPKLPPRPFTAPSAGRAARVASGKGHDVDAPPPMDVVSSTDLNIAIVGLNPSDKAMALPVASSPGQFSAGPVVRPKGADSDGGGAGLAVPNLVVRGPADRKSNMIAQAYASPTSSENLRAALSRGEPMMTVHVDPPASAAHTGAMKVSGAPDPRFNGREVFMMAIQMPNITSYSGSWLMWYSDRTAHEAGLAPIAPPVAHRKVDPKYIATAVSERIEGRVTLACVIDKAGRVLSVEVVRGLDERLNKSAEEALSKWEFYPATRKGEPVDVDVLVEIPFRLEPRIERR